MKLDKRIQAALIIMLIGGVLSFFYYLKINKANSSSSWPSTTGKVISSNVKQSLFNILRIRPRRNGFRRRGDSFYYIDIQYEYEVEGAPYTSDRLSLLSNYIKNPSYSETVKKYKKNKKLTVYYNPEKPEQAILVRGADKDYGGPLQKYSYFTVLAGAFFLAYAVFKSIKGED